MFGSRVLQIILHPYLYLQLNRNTSLNRMTKKGLEKKAAQQFICQHYE